MEVTGLSSAEAATSRARPATSTDKVLVGLCAVVLASVVSPVWAAILLVGFLVVLWRRPGIGWMPWSLFLGGVLLLAALFQMGVSQAGHRL
jgi:hypothetical protein